MNATGSRGIIEDMGSLTGLDLLAPGRRRVAGALRAVASWSLDVIMPPICPMCRGAINLHGSLCAGCWPKLSFLDAPLCVRLGTPFSYDPGEGVVSPRAAARPPVWNRARGAVQFDTHSRQIVHALKYRDRHEVAQLMGRLMRRAGAELIEDADLILPVPLYSFRLWRRRFNQSAILARHVVEGTQVSVRLDVLRRDRPTRSQVGLDHADRRRNVRNAFSVPEVMKPELIGKRCVLVDDVLTTGATAEACAEVLLQAGAQTVDVLVFALVIRPSGSHI